MLIRTFHGTSPPLQSKKRASLHVRKLARMSPNLIPQRDVRPFLPSKQPIRLTVVRQTVLIHILRSNIDFSICPGNESVLDLQIRKNLFIAKRFKNRAFEFRRVE